MDNNDLKALILNVKRACMHIYARESVSGTHVFPLSVLCNSYNSVLQLWCNLQNKPVQPSGLTTNVLNLTKINTSNILGIILCH